ncbi:hypothetical protein VTK73DRAFT_7410 [Phialemonium thermophilum]|uniref:Malate dehydrogenase n=1 Tax=Phialemonium thermophilum TaxID=223376 RepID=A0ABR3XSV5_9PEZI
MHASVISMAALAACALAAPKFPQLDLDAAQPGSLEAVSEYFNLLAYKVQESRYLREAPACDLSKAQQPIAPTPLPPPTAGLILKHVAIGRGTQNYTCDANNATAVPVANGALATLFNASCVAAAYPDMLNMLPRVALLFNLTAPPVPSESAPVLSPASVRMAPSNLTVSGVHFFTNATTPYFNLDTDGGLSLGQIPCAKNNTADAPADAPRGQEGETAVPWLKLIAKDGATGDLQEVYRVETAGGSAPATCEGMPASFEVQYSAQYWFYSGKPE